MLYCCYTAGDIWDMIVCGEGIIYVRHLTEWSTLDYRMDDIPIYDVSCMYVIL